MSVFVTVLVVMSICAVLLVIMSVCAILLVIMLPTISVCVSLVIVSV